MVLSARILAFAYLIVTGVLAVVIIATLLLIGVKPHTVFLAGFAVKALGELMGLHVPNAVGVVSTVLLVWAVILGVRLAVAKLARRRAT